MKDNRLREANRYLEIADEAKPLTDEQKSKLKDRYGFNLTLHGVKTHEDCGRRYLVFDNCGGTHNNWKYYAGFEYIEEPTFSLSIESDHLLIYDDHEERVEGIFAMMNEGPDEK